MKNQLDFNAPFSCMTPEGAGFINCFAAALIEQIEWYALFITSDT